MEQSGEPRLAVEIVLFMDQEGFHQQAMLGHRKGMWALGLAIPARHPCQAMGDVLDFDIER